MDEQNTYFVDFYKYCKKCEHEDLNEKYEPCNECLTIAGRVGTRKPQYYKEKKK